MRIIQRLNRLGCMVAIDWNPDARKLRNFGFIALGGFLFAAGIVYWKQGADPGPVARYIISTLLALAIVCPIFSVIAPRVNRPVWIIMSLVAIPIGFVISHLVMGLIYYVIITPVGLFFKLTGRDAMMRRLDKEAPTYWEERPAPPEPKRYFRQF